MSARFLGISESALPIVLIIFLCGVALEEGRLRFFPWAKTNLILPQTCLEQIKLDVAEYFSSRLFRVIFGY